MKNLILIMYIFNKDNKKRASYLRHTAQPLTLATFRSWGSSAGAGCVRLARCKYILIALYYEYFILKKIAQKNNYICQESLKQNNERLYP